MKVQAKGTFKSYYFLVNKRQYKKTDRLCMKISITSSTIVQQVIQPTFLNARLFCCPLCSKEHLNPKVMMNKLDFKGHHKECHDPLVTKLIQWILIMMLNCCAKNEVKRSSHSGDNLCKGIKQSDEKILGPKLRNQTVKPLEITESICSFYGCLPTCKKSVIAQFSLDI